MDSEKEPSGSENLKTSVDNEESAPKGEKKTRKNS